ncbi:hypothetical protein THAR02_02311 [Trichoderma harzianum]|uniref:chitinase n=1 Tax=Trichoderma harzianum TaxID=5544 RepID=A0A0F9XM67_TRIHA|nr:hypothetical protein THAR02_02311 [Trichoderma harzianum]
MAKLAWVAVILNLALCTSGSEFFSQLERCPNSCTTLGPIPSNWTYIHRLEKLNSCNETVLFDLSLHNDVAVPETHTTFRACTVEDGPKLNDTNLSVKWAASTSTSISLQRTWSENNVKFNQDQFDGLSGAIQQHVIGLDAEAPTIIFSKVDSLVMGFFARGSIDSSRSIATIMNELTSQVKANGLGETTLVERCGEGINGNHTFGLVGLANTKQSNVNIFIKPTIKSNVSERGIEPRDGTCSTIQVVSGDSCGSLAAECGISAQQFAQFNPSPTLCSTLAVGQYVCCTSGSLPDRSPQPNPDGSCARYNVQPGDYCALIAAENSITTDDIENFNKNTWGWQGCGNVQLGQIICLSTGSPPFPAAVSNAICGPQVPGTQPPADFSTITALNPCPLNACCDIFGQCGITPDFCTASQSATGTPGTSAPGTAGCISNCGIEIVNNINGSSEFIKVGYWESFGLDRPCLQMPVSAIPSGYTHIHYAFATLTSDFQVDVSVEQDAFNQFAAANGFKRILSFGGWSFSTDVDSFPIFRESVTDANRLTFAQSAPDIPGIPPGSPQDGANYLAFLTTLRGLLPSGKTLSLAAPASYRVNSTETFFALAMIAKAGVPTNKIAVGVTSYGRSFGMLDPSSGYLADAEIYQLIAQGGVRFKDDQSDSDLVTFGDTWVSYMTPATKAIDLENGVTGGSNATGAAGDHSTPSKVPVVSLTCTTLAPSATFTLTAACASEIAGLPPRTNNNSPPGPDNCTETCDLLREITGTCCGIGGTIANPVAIIPNVKIPLPVPLSGITPGSGSPIVVPGVSLQPFQPAPIPIPLPAGYSPSSTITFPGVYYPPGIPLPFPVILPTGYSPSTTISFDSTTLPANVPLSSVVIIPAGFVPPGPLPFFAPPFTLNPGDKLPGPVVIPPGFAPVAPFTAPTISYPAGQTIPPGIFIPPGIDVPAPIGIPAGAPLSPDFTPIASGTDPEDEDEPRCSARSVLSISVTSSPTPSSSPSPSPSPSPTPPDYTKICGFTPSCTKNCGQTIQPCPIFCCAECPPSDIVGIAC